LQIAVDYLPKILSRNFNLMAKKKAAKKKERR